jgi:hypothetical protein
MSEPQVGESYTREGLPDEVFRRIMRRADAEQNRYVNLGRTVDALESLGRNLTALNHTMNRVANAFDRLLKQITPDEPETEVPHNEAGLPIPPWVDES